MIRYKSDLTLPLVQLLKVRFVETIDKTSVGKVSQVKLREKYAG